MIDFDQKIAGVSTGNETSYLFFLLKAHSYLSFHNFETGLRHAVEAVSQALAVSHLTFSQFSLTGYTVPEEIYYHEQKARFYFHYLVSLSKDHFSLGPKGEVMAYFLYAADQYAKKKGWRLE